VKRLVLILALTLAGPASADSSLPPAYWANRQLPDARQEARATALMEELRCLVCQGQSIADSDAEIAGDMRDLVRRRIAAGERPEAIRAWLVERYGSWVSYKPAASASTWALWLAPLLFLVVGGWMAASRIERRSKD
jgi:cytochrome c-type biogenesis protein CcmH